VHHFVLNHSPVLSVREGNAPLPEKHEFKEIKSFEELFVLFSFEKKRKE